MSKENKNNEEFKSMSMLVGWLERQGIEDKCILDSHSVKQILWTSGFRSSFTLIGASADALLEYPFRLQIF